MSIPSAITGLLDPNRYANLQWKRLPDTVVARPIPPELKAELDAREAGAAKVQAELQAEREANPDLYAASFENNTYYATNVATIEPERIQSTIRRIESLIESGEAEKYDFYSGKGEKATRSMHEYLYWLQLRAAELDSDGTYSPEMFR